MTKYAISIFSIRKGCFFNTQKGVDAYSIGHRVQKSIFSFLRGGRVVCPFVMRLFGIAGDKEQDEDM